MEISPVPPRYYAPDLAPGEFSLPQEEIHHLRNVRRADQNQQVEVFDGRGTSAVCRIIELQRRTATLEALEIHHHEQPARRLIIATAIPKGDRMMTLVEKTTELDAWAIRPLLTERGIVKAEGNARRDAWRQRAVEAAKQCGRVWLPEILAPQPLNQFLAAIRPTTGKIASQHQNSKQAASLPAHKIILLDPDPGATPLPELLNALRRKQSAAAETATGQSAPAPAPAAAPAAASLELTALIGPEGGFSPDEMQLALAAGAQPARLAPNILRIETAAIAVAAVWAAQML